MRRKKKTTKYPNTMVTKYHMLYNKTNFVVIEYPGQSHNKRHGQY